MSSLVDIFIDAYGIPSRQQPNCFRPKYRFPALPRGYLRLSLSWIAISESANKTLYRAELGWANWQEGTTEPSCDQPSYMLLLAVSAENIPSSGG